MARLHAAAMGNSLWARLGPAFLEAIYECLVPSPFFLGFVYIEDSRARGFIAGSTDTKRMYRETLKRHGIRLALAAGRGLLRQPGLLPRLLGTGGYFDDSGDEIKGESLFCSFEPELRGRRISGLINKVLFDELLARGHKRVKITTDADNPDSARQLQSWGFLEDRRFLFYGKEMVRYVLDLESSPRVEATSRHPAV